jgi:hypothetical protein
VRRKANPAFLFRSKIYPIKKAFDPLCRSKAFPLIILATVAVSPVQVAVVVQRVVERNRYSVR